MELPELLGALSPALDLAAGEPRGHARRAHAIGLALGERLGLDPGERAALGYALLLKDAGPEAAATIDCDERATRAIAARGEHWDGRGDPDGLEREAIPLLARVVCVAETAERFWRVGGADAAVAAARERRGTWLDPALVDELAGLDWAALAQRTPTMGGDPVDDERLDRVAAAFGRVVDARSPFGIGHSAAVARMAVELGYLLGLDEAARRDLHRAGLLHDLGLLDVPPELLDRRGSLEPEAWEAVFRHPRTALEILSGVDALRDVARLVAVHHERLDGSGYFLGLEGPRLDPAARVLAVAEAAQALGPGVALHAGTKLDPDACEAYEALAERALNVELLV